MFHTDLTCKFVQLHLLERNVEADALSETNDSTIAAELNRSQRDELVPNDENVPAGEATDMPIEGTFVLRIADISFEYKF